MEITAIETINYEELKSALPEELYSRVALELESAFADGPCKSSYLMRQLYGVVTYEDYEQIMSIIATEL